MDENEIIYKYGHYFSFINSKSFFVAEQNMRHSTHKLRQRRSGFALKAGRREVLGSNYGRACRPSR